MINSSKEKNIYSEIQKRLFYIIPEKWESIYLYASVVDVPNKRPVGEMYFYYFPKGIIKKKAVNCYEIPNAFNIDDDEYSNLITKLYNTIKSLRQVWYDKTQKKWTSVTISIENSKFKIEYDYQDLNTSKFNSYERHIIWKYIYLKLDLQLFGNKDKKIINEYMKFCMEHKLTKKDVYIENIYEKPVKNIVDYEKTLSVEEAIAQSEDIEVENEKRKNYLFKKNKPVEDIIDLDEDENDSINNQILNWKEK